MQCCAIILDLLPLYIDGLASPETVKLVEEHLLQCADCQAVLEQMKTPAPVYNPAKNDQFTQVLKKQRNRNTRKAVVVSVLVLLLAALVLAAVLWFSDLFWYIGSYSSPDGLTKTKVYRSDVTELIPVKGRFTLVDEGKFQGRTVLWGEFDGLWWSQDSQYQVVSLMDHGECWLTLFDYVRNTGNNLDHRLENSLYGMEAFDAVSRDEEGQKQIEFRFLQWSKFDNSMLIYFSYLDTDGVDRDGYFWYNYDSGIASGVTHIETMVISGVVKEIGADHYVMDLDQLDENGNVREFVFRISDQTALRGLQALTVGDQVQVVLRGPEEYARTPWDLVFGQAERTEIPTAISVTSNQE